MAVALGHGTSLLVLTLAGTVAYIGVNVVTTAHRALVHDCFEREQYAQAFRGSGLARALPAARPQGSFANTGPGESASGRRLQAAVKNPRLL